MSTRPQCSGGDDLAPMHCACAEAEATGVCCWCGSTRDVELEPRPSVEVRAYGPGRHAVLIGVPHGLQAAQVAELEALVQRYTGATALVVAGLSHAVAL